MPRVFSVKERIDRSIYHKESLIKNLKSGKYDVRYGELDWKSDSYNYKDYRILTNKELIEDLLERYSDIKTRYWEKIISAVKDDRTKSINNLCHYIVNGKRIIGKTNIERLFIFLTKYNSGKLPIMDSLFKQDSSL